VNFASLFTNARGDPLGEFWVVRELPDMLDGLKFGYRFLYFRGLP
jgi:hypothetical protein